MFEGTESANPTVPVNSTGSPPSNAGSWDAQFSLNSQAPTVCVDAVVPGTTEQERQSLRRRVEEWVQEKGFATTDCDTAEWTLLVEPISGTTVSDDVYFVGSVATSPGLAVGTLSVSHPEISFKSWIVTLYPKARILDGDQTLSYSLHGGVNKMLKKLRKVSRKAD